MDTIKRTKEKSEMTMFELMRENIWLKKELEDNKKLIEKMKISNTLVTL